MEKKIQDAHYYSLHICYIKQQSIFLQVNGMCSKGEVEIEFEFPTSNWGTGNPSHFRLGTNPLDLINQSVMIYTIISNGLKNSF